MIGKIIGVLLIISGIGLFIGVFSGAADPGDLIYGTGFIAFGIFLFSRGRKKKQDKQEFSEKENLKEEPIFRQTNKKMKSRKSVPWVCRHCGYANTINEVACEKCNKV